MKNGQDGQIFAYTYTKKHKNNDFIFKSCLVLINSKKYIFVKRRYGIPTDFNCKDAWLQKVSVSLNNKEISNGYCIFNDL